MTKHAVAHPAPGMKRCPVCKEVKPLSAFPGIKRISCYCTPCKITRRNNSPEGSWESITARFFKKTNKNGPNGCWVWMGVKNGDGHGQIWTGGKPWQRPAHRISLQIAGIEIPEGMFVDHICRNRACVNPEHLRVVTPTVNALENNASTFAAYANRTHCKNQHLYTPKTVRWVPCVGPKGTPMATRLCLICYRTKHPGPSRTDMSPNTREDALTAARAKKARKSNVALTEQKVEHDTEVEQRWPNAVTPNPNEKGITMSTGPSIEYIARVAHEVNRAYCSALGDNSQPPWDEAPEWQRTSAVNGVTLHLHNPDAGPQASHEAWFKEKQETGWKYGPVKNPEAKEHPCMVAFNELPREQQAKDFLFRGVVLALAE